MAEVLKELTAREQIVKIVRDTSQELFRAYGIAIRSNPLASEVPTVKSINDIAQKLNTIIQDVNKLRGL